MNSPNSYYALLATALLAAALTYALSTLDLLISRWRTRRKARRTQRPTFTLPPRPDDNERRALLAARLAAFNSQGVEDLQRALQAAKDTRQSGLQAGRACGATKS